MRALQKLLHCRAGYHQPKAFTEEALKEDGAYIYRVTTTRHVCGVCGAAVSGLEGQGRRERLARIVRDPNPSDDCDRFCLGETDEYADCGTDGHYMCAECIHKKPAEEAPCKE